MARGRVDRAALRQDLAHLVAQWFGRPLGEIALGTILGQSMVVVRQHHLQLPANLSLLLKTLMMSEGLAARLDPSFNMMTVLAPYAQRLMLEQCSPLRWGRQLGRASLEAARLGISLPIELRWLLADLQRGGLEVAARPVGTAPLLRRAEQLVNRIVFGIIAAAFINGLAMLMAVYHPPGWEQWRGAFSAFGFVAATVLGVYLAWSILRSGHR